MRFFVNDTCSIIIIEDDNFFICPLPWFIIVCRRGTVHTPAGGGGRGLESKKQSWPIAGTNPVVVVVVVVVVVDGDITRYSLFIPRNMLRLTWSLTERMTL
jgi:hypothetical protein